MRVNFGFPIAFFHVIYPGKHAELAILAACLLLVS